MVDPGLINYCERQTRDGTPKVRRLAEASVSAMRLVSRLPDPVAKGAVESVVLELYPGYLDQKNGTHKAQAESRHFLTSSKVDRINGAKLKERQMKLLNVIVQVALGLFQSANYQAALVAAQQYLVLIADVNGTSSLTLIPAYAMIAELEIKLNKLREAEQQLQKANWVVMQNERTHNVDQVKQQLYRLLGLLHAKRGNNTEAIRLFAEQICFASALGGTESIGSASGYFNIAQAIGDTHAKCSLFNKALECWSQRIFDDDLDTMSDPDKYQALMMLFELNSYFKENNQLDETLLSTGILSKFANQFQLPGGDEYKAQFQAQLGESDQAQQQRSQILMRLT